VQAKNIDVIFFNDSYLKYSQSVKRMELTRIK